MAYAERPDAVAGPGEVVIELLAAGICGTDLHIEAGEYPCLPPVTMGHELCGSRGRARARRGRGLGGLRA